MVLLIVLIGYLWAVNPVLAVTVKAISPAPTPSSSAEATVSAQPSSKPEELKIQQVEQPKENITAPTPKIKGKLESYLVEHTLKPLSITNFLQHAVRRAVENGVPATTIVLVLLFPLVAAIIAASRHMIGIRGFGIFLPAVLSVVFVATGIIEGLLLFLTIIVVATGARMLVKKMKLQYLPRMALLLWFVSLAVFGLLFIAPFLNLITITSLSIFPILMMILLAENFINIHSGMSMKEAISMSMETLVMALICSFVLQLEFLQKFVLVNPEISVVIVALLDIFMGKYVGLRFLEYKKFKEIIK